MASEWAYEVDVSRVVSEGIDGEVLAIDNETGTYFNIEGSGVEMWLALVGGAARSDVIDAVTARYEVSDQTAGEHADRFVSELVELKVVRPVSMEARDVSTQTYPDRIPFREANLGVYTDLQDLLLFDPIHEVAEAGWPHRPE